MGRVTERCDGCVKIGKGACMVLTDPIYFWSKYGTCFARSEDPIFWIKLKETVSKYSKRQLAS